MAADVRNFNLSLSQQVEPKIMEPPSSTINRSSSGSSVQTEISSPSYAIVQEQMRDLILIQEAAIGNLTRTNMETLSASKDIFDATLQAKDERIINLQKSIANDYVKREMHDALTVRLKNDFVPKENFESLQSQLKFECDKHVETQAALQDVIVQLDESQEKMKAMESQRENELAAFDIAYNNLKKDLAEALAKNNFLQSKLSEQHLVFEKQQEEIISQQHLVEDLQRKQQSQTQRYRHKMRESEVEKQQEAYLQQMMADMEHKNRKKMK